MNWADNQLFKPVMLVKPRFVKIVFATCRSVLPEKSLESQFAATVAGAVVLTST